MYLKDFWFYRKGLPDYSGCINVYIRFENQIEYKEIEDIKSYEKCIISHFDGFTKIYKNNLDTELNTYFTLKVKTLFTLKEYLEVTDIPVNYKERINTNVTLIIKGEKYLLTLNPVSYFKFKDRIVRKVFSNSIGNYIWLKE